MAKVILQHGTRPPPWDKEWARAFKERYLNWHHRFLGSASDLITQLYWGDGDDPWSRIANGISRKPDVSQVIIARRMGQCDKDLALRNLRNAWYNEAALWDPEQIEQRERMRWAAWKIAQFYYAIFLGVSAIVRCVDARPKRSHETVLDIWGNQLLDNRRFRDTFFLCPFSLYIHPKGYFRRPPETEVNWRYGEEYHIPNLHKCLQSAAAKRSGSLVTLFHYFRDLREWAQYQDAYVMGRLYSSAVAEELERYLQQISFAWLMLVEEWLIHYFDPESVLQEYQRFTKLVESVHKVKITPLTHRFDAHIALLT